MAAVVVAWRLRAEIRVIVGGMPRTRRPEEAQKDEQRHDRPGTNYHLATVRSAFGNVKESAVSGQRTNGNSYLRRRSLIEISKSEGCSVSNVRETARAARATAAI